MQNGDKKKKITLLSLLLLILCFLYLGGKSTYTAFESLIMGRVHTNTAQIQLKINGFDIMKNEELDMNVILNNITWESTHTREKKISPGSHGVIDLELDPTGSEVSILYEFQFVDKVIDEDKLINFGTITADHDLVKTGIDTYSGILTLTQVTEGDKVHLEVPFYFDYINDIEGITEDNQVLDDLFEIHFHAIQYRGEELIPYVGE